MSNPIKNLTNHPAVKHHLDLLEIWLQANRAYTGLPSVTVGIVYDQALIYAKGFGYANVATQTLATPDTIYRIASHSKLFTAISVMQLRDEGKLQLGDPIKNYLPWFEMKNKGQTDDPITLRQLLVHTAGLPREAGSSYWIDFDFPTVEEIKARLPKMNTIFPPETRWKYSNLALTLAGEIVAVVSGKPYATYVEENILTPLGMTGTSVIFPKEQEARLAVGYGRRLPDGKRTVMPFIDAKSMASATGFSSTVADMARFVSWQLRLREGNQPEILKPATLREMQRVHWVEDHWQSGWGIGFSLSHYPERTLVGHGGAYPGYLTNTRISPQENMGVVVFTNTLDAQPDLILNRIFDWIAPAIKQALTDQHSPNPDPAWQQYIGSYRSLWTDYHVLPLDGKLRLIVPNTSNPKEKLMTLEPISEHTFRLEGPGTVAVGEAVVFEINQAGQATRMVVGHNPAIRFTYPE